MQICILEDCEERRTVMRACLADRFSQFAVSFAADAAAFVERLKRAGLADVALIALDHDLEMIDDGRGVLRDPGTGRQAADWLASVTPSCPVIIHSTNSAAASGMQQSLDEAGWTTHRALPFVEPLQPGELSANRELQPADAAWINTVWFRDCRDAIVESVRRPAGRGRAIETHVHGF